MKILVVGAGLAGLTAAAYLGRAGHEVEIAEWAQELRASGHPVDLWGTALDIVTDLGLAAQVQAAAMPTRTARTCMAGWGCATLSLADLERPIASAHVELLRGDLVRQLWAAAAPFVRLRLGIGPIGLTPSGDHVDVDFSAGGGRYDLILGADGVRSQVRSLVFGGGADRPMDIFVGGFSAPGGSAPDATVERRLAAKATAWSFPMVEAGRRGYGFMARMAPREPAGSPEARLRAIRDRLDWPSSAVVEEGLVAPDFYADRVMRIELDRWRRGRVALIGDAAWSPGMALGGGASLAVGGAALLAGFLNRGGDVADAIDRFEALLRPVAIRASKIAEPMSRALIPDGGLAARGGVLALKLLSALPEGLSRRMPLYPSPVLRGLRSIAGIPLHTSSAHTSADAQRALSGGQPPA